MLLAMCCMSHCLRVQKALQSHAAPFSLLSLIRSHPFSTARFYTLPITFYKSISVILVRLIPFLRTLSFYSSHFLFPLLLLPRSRPSRCLFSVLNMLVQMLRLLLLVLLILLLSLVFFNSTRLDLARYLLFSYKFLVPCMHAQCSHCGKNSIRFLFSNFFSFALVLRALGRFSFDIFLSFPLYLCSHSFIVAEVFSVVAIRLSSLLFFSNFFPGVHVIFFAVFRCECVRGLEYFSQRKKSRGEKKK